MASDAQINANRKNAKKSTGPRTPEGKAAAARNAISTGLYTTPDFYSQDETDTFIEFCTGLRLDLAPEGSIEEIAADQIVHAAWRLRRCAYAEAAFSGDEDDPMDGCAETQASVERVRNAANRIFHRQLAELRRLQSERLAHTRVESSTPVEDLGVAPLLKLETKIAKFEKRSQFAPAFTPRNAECPCGSGQKFKRCCGEDAPPVLNAPPAPDALPEAA